MPFSRLENLLVVLIMTAILTTGASFVVQNKNYFPKKAVSVSSKDNVSTPVVVEKETPPPPPPQKLSNPPDIIKAVYVTGYSAGSKSYLRYLSDLFKNTEINAVVVDVKGSGGYISYASGAPDVEKYSLYRSSIKDIDSLIRFFHDQNIYVIGRIAVFEDPVYSKVRPDLAVYNKTKTTVSAETGEVDPSKLVLWQDNHGVSWLDPAAKDVWDYNISLAKDAFYHGFDEVNFDYVRFPSDGKVADMGFPFWDDKSPKSQTIKDFFEYTRQQLADDKISVDLFGLTTVNTDDMGIGQIIENAFANFDYVSPMVYPSHYANGFISFDNPANHPYEVIKYSMDNALAKEKIFTKKQQDLALRNSEVAAASVPQLQSLISATAKAVTLNSITASKFRPWLQDFNMGADYTSDMVKQEIKATQDALGKDFSGFMLWNPSNIYTQDAVKKAETKQ